MRVLLLNGPNLNLLGTRRPEIYGSTTLGEVEDLFRRWATDAGVRRVETFQSNHEGALIDRIHEARDGIDGIVFNPGAFTHTSYALHDALESVEIPTVEVHISNVEEREPWRRTSVIRPACAHTIYGRGVDGYRWGLLHLVNRSAVPVERLVYGDDPSQFADLRLPGDPSAPLVVLVHGGFWRHHWTRDTTESIAVDLVQRGFATLNVEFRRIGAGGSADTMVADVRTCMERVKEDGLIDRRPWLIVGHSAGGQLALVAVSDIDAPPPSAVITMGGVSDLRAAVDQDLGNGAAAAYLDGAAPERFSPTRLVPLPGPLIIAHGTSDDRVPFEQAERLMTAQRKAGGEALLLSGPHGHFEYLDPASPPWHDLVDAIEARTRP
jgi:3-dehydroquinate dehydratase-2